MIQNQQRFFNRLVLAQVYIFSKQCERDNYSMPDIAYKIKTAGFNSFHINRFDDNERDCVKKISEIPELVELKGTRSSAIINVLELMRIWVEDVPREDRPIINISDNKLLLGRNHYTIHMLKLKKKDSKIHAEMRELLSVSSESVEKWYNTAKNYIKENCHD